MLRPRVWIVLAVSCLIIAGGLVAMRLSSRPLISGSITSKVSFVILVPKKSTYSVDKSSVSYSQDSKVLTFVIRKGDQAITVTEQAVPSVMASYPEMLSRQFDLMKDKKTLATPIGTAYVANNQDINSQQLAAINGKGTLVFLRPSGRLDEDGWRRLFNQLDSL